MKLHSTFFLFCFFLIGNKHLQSQNTVGLLSYDITQSFQGYTMIYPHEQPNVYLLNNCGEIVHTWTDEEDYRPGNTAYLRPDGSLVKAKRNAVVAGNVIWSGGGGAIIEVRSWENDLISSFELNNDTARLHHDIAVMPNGHILAIVWDLQSNAEAIENGRDPGLLAQGVLWSERIIEIDPSTGDIVWEWYLWDHLIQDFDNTKANFGVVSEHKELVNLNWDTSNGAPSWVHANAIDYNPALDQILLSAPTFNELWIIDHSTTTEQAAGNSGGNSNKGGDLLYRVGNPAAYDKGDVSNQILFFQHGANWAIDFLPSSHPFYEHIVCFNNRVGADFSAIEIFEAPWDMYDSNYFVAVDGTYPPASFENTITHPEPTSFYSPGLSSAQILPNGNMLSCSGRQGYIVELTPDNDIVWEYITPFKAGQPASQGDTLVTNDNLTFRAFRYPPDYSAFDGKDLTAKGFIENNPNEDYCDQFVSTTIPEQYNIEVYPNPATDMIHLSWDSGKIITIKIYDLLGRWRATETGNGGMAFLDVTGFEAGMYFLELEDIGVVKIILE